MLRPAFGVAALALALTAQASAQEVSANDAYEIAEDAYVYAYPLMVMDASVRQLSNFAEPAGIVTQAPFNQFSHAQAFPPADYKGVVRANADTLYSTANLDLGPEPIVLSVPATDRYFMMPMLSLWTDVFAVPGTRTTGRNTAGDFVIVGPRWQGDVPAGLEVIRSPTRFRGDRRPHADEWSCRLRQCPQDPGRLQAHPSVRMGQGRLCAAQGQCGLGDRYEDTAAGAGREDGCRSIFRTLRRAAEGQSAKRIRLSDDPPPGAGRLQGGAKLRPQYRTTRRQAGVRAPHH
jgi:hypothetical protein